MPYRLKVEGQSKKFKSNVIIIPESQTVWVSQIRLQNHALRLGLSSWLALSKFHAQTRVKSEIFSEGSYVISMSASHWSNGKRLLLKIAKRLRVSVTEPTAPFTALVTGINRPTVGVLSDAGSPYAFYDILSSTGFDVVPVSSSMVRDGWLDKVHAFMIPGGGFKGPTFQSAALGKRGRESLRKFALYGGAVWGSCAGAIILINLGSGVRKRLSDEAPELPTLTSSNLIKAKYWGNGDMGIGLLGCELESELDPLLIGLPNRFELTWHLGPCISLQPSTCRWVEPLIRNRKLTTRYTPAECMQSSRPLEKTYTSRSFHKTTHAMVASRLGRGLVVASGAHPEFGPDVLLEDWRIPSRILTNFIQIGSARKPITWHPPMLETDLSGAFEYAIEFSLANLREISKLIGELKASNNDWWLLPAYAPSSFGGSARKNWPIILRRLRRAARELPSLCREVQRLRRNTNAVLIERLGRKQSEYESLVHFNILKELASQSLWLEEDLTAGKFGILNAPRSDYGWQTVPTLLEECKSKLIRAISVIHNETSQPALSPYMLIWGMYLGAVFDLINCSIMLRRRIEILRDLLFIIDEF